MGKLQTPTVVKLFNPLTNQNLNLKASKINGLVFNKISEIESRFRNIRKESNLLFLLSSKQEDLAKLMENSENKAMLEPILQGIASGSLSVDDVINIMESGQGTVSVSNMERRFEILKAVIDFTALAPDIVELLNSEFSSDFWQSQDWEEVADQADLFRSVIRR